MGQQNPICRTSGAQSNSDSCLRLTPGDCGGCDQNSKTCGPFGAFHIGHAPLDMTVGDMGGLMGDDRLQLICILKLQHQARMNEYVIMVDHEGI